jgi:hypothetical protein
MLSSEARDRDIQNLSHASNSSLYLKTTMRMIGRKGKRERTCACVYVSKDQQKNSVPQTTRKERKNVCTEHFLERPIVN